MVDKDLAQRQKKRVEGLTLLFVNLRCLLKYFLVGTFLLAHATLLAGSVNAQESKESASFFKDKTLTYIVATKPGGGYDTYARLLAPTFGAKLGVRKVVVKNIPGAGHLIGLKALSVADPDGLTIGTFNTGLIYAQLGGQDAMSVDLREMSWIGKASSDARILLLGANSGFSSIEDLRESKKPVVFGSSGVNSASFIEASLLSSVLGIDNKMVTGFAGAEAELGILRGDLDAIVGSYSSLAPFIDAGNGKVALAWGGEVPDDPKRFRDLGDISHENAGVLVLVQNLTILGRLTAAPAGLSPEILEALSQAYADAISDPELQQRARDIGVPLDPATGNEVQFKILETLNQPKEVIDRFLELYTDF